jgi:hypothetical protein
MCGALSHPSRRSFPFKATVAREKSGDDDQSDENGVGRLEE